MNNLIIDESFWEIFPNAQINVLIVKGINNALSKDDEYVDLLTRSSIDAKKHLLEDTFSDNSIVKQWREDYKKFKKKKGARSSIEALLKRISQGKSIPSINPLVDMYNSVSLSYGVPVGGEDLDKISGNLTLGVATGGQAFYPLGDEDNDPALQGEIIYQDDVGAVCRCLNWRDGQRTMLSEHTTNAILFIESMHLETHDNVNEATNALQQVIEEHLNQSVEQHHLSWEHNSLQIG